MTRQLIVLIVILSMCIFQFTSTPNTPNTEMPHLVKSSSHIDHDCFYIQGNQMLLDVAALEGWQGNGTVDNPIIIEGYRFTSTGHVFTASSIDLYFEFRNNILDGITDRWCVIVLSNLTNGYFHNNTIMRGSVGFHIIRTTDSVFANNTIHGQSWDAFYVEIGCSHNTIINNHLYDFGEAGVYSEVDGAENWFIDNEVHDAIYGFAFLEDASHNLVQGNNIHDVHYGVYIVNEGNHIINNTIHHVSSDGVLVKDTRDTFIEYNLIHSNGRYGVHLFDNSNQSTVCNNTFINNENYAVRISYSDQNVIEHNNFVENGVPEAYDRGQDNTFRYNYWSNWTGNDENADGFIDTPYPIAGTAMSADDYPTTGPIGALPDWYLNPTTTSTSNTSTTTASTSSQPTSATSSITQTPTEGTTPSRPSSVDSGPPMMIALIGLVILIPVIIWIGRRES